MSYPTVRPSARDYTHGDWATKKVTSMSGVETRLRYGDKRFGATFKLEYANISDSTASLFLQHYQEQLGTFKTFVLPMEVFAGWSGPTYLPLPTEMRFRYDTPPQLRSVRPGISSVSVELRGVV